MPSLLFAVLLYALPHPTTVAVPAAGRTGESGTVREDPWLARDKLDHLWGSFVLAGMGTICASQSVNRPSMRGPAFGLAVPMAAGLAKEWMDGRKPGRRFSWRDMAANAAGALLACLFCSLAAPG